MTDVRPAPYVGMTMPFASLSVVDYGRRMDEWLGNLKKEQMAPEQEDIDIIEQVMRRIRVEFELDREGSDLPKGHSDRAAREEPIRGFVHGGPGTGKSRLIHWITRMFREALHWEHGVQFMCVAFQNRVAHAM
eukprot:1338153-Pyramimonas_sp.AAC.1